MANCEIYFPIFSETIHTILKMFSQHDLRKFSRGYCTKNRVLEFWSKFLARFSQCF